MRRQTPLSPAGRCGALFLLVSGFAIAGLAVTPVPLRAATISVVNLDDPGEGFNDPTPVAPVGGNPHTTRGEQAFYVFQYAANIWASLLESPVVIVIEANFDPLDCDSTSGVLGSAGPNTIHSDFDNAPHSMTWYHQALANKLAGSDQDPTTADIGITFNSEAGKPGCLQNSGWYFGVDGNEGTGIELLPVVLHEMGHGLGFSTSTIAGVQEVFPSIYDYFLYDDTQGMHWPDMTEPQRVASAQNCNRLVWDGANVMSQAPLRLGPKPLMRVNGASPIAGDYAVGLASFGPGLNTTGVTADLVLANDGMGVPTNGCEPFLNGAQVAGRIALVDRGACTFVTKVKNAQNAGAIAVVVADTMAGCPPAGLGGADPTIVIPAVRVTQDVGAQLKAALQLGTVNVTLRLDPALKAGMDAAGHVQVFTPLPYQLGSSVSHWDTSAEPNLLMEPALNNSLSHDPDLTLAQFADIGWFIGNTGVADGTHGRRLEPSFPNPTSSAATFAFSLAREERVDLSVFDVGGRRMARLLEGRVPEGRHTVTWDGNDDAGRAAPSGVYRYVLRSAGKSEARNFVIVR